SSAGRAAWGSWTRPRSSEVCFSASFRGVLPWPYPPQHRLEVPVSPPRALPHATGTLLLLLALTSAVAAAPLVPTVKPVPARTRVHATFVPGEVVVALPAGERFTRGLRGEAIVPDARRTALLADLGLAPVRVLGDDPGATVELSSGYALLRSASPDFD